MIILSAKSSVGDKVKNLINGAADYITKPFNNDELLARIAVQFRDIKNENSGVLKWKDIELVHISSLRHKLKEASNEDYIETVWGIGFKLKS